MAIEKVVRKTTLHQQGNDFAFWQSRPYQDRLAAVEQIRREYHRWKYGTEPGFRRVLTISQLDGLVESPSDLDDLP